jgi:chromodomain-helicase-DNA-binding protein 7
MEEVEQMKQTNNDQVNAQYMARYSYAREHLKAPTDNSDLQLLKIWIRRKYHDKAWYSVKGGGGGDAEGGPGPTVVQVPPEKKQPAQDLLGFDSAAAPAAQAPAPSNNNWDAFGGGNVPAPQANPAFQANFASFDQTQSAPQQQPQQAPPSIQQQQGFANFSSPQAQGQPPHQQQQQKQQSQMNGFADFGQQQFQPPQPAQQNQGFANFGQPTVPPQQNQAFAAFPQPGSGQQEQNQATPVQGRQGFATFPQPGPGQQGQNASTQAPGQQGFAAFPQSGPGQQQQPPSQNQFHAPNQVPGTQIGPPVHGQVQSQHPPTQPPGQPQSFPHGSQGSSAPPLQQMLQFPNQAGGGMPQPQFTAQPPAHQGPPPSQELHQHAPAPMPQVVGHFQQAPAQTQQQFPNQASGFPQPQASMQAPTQQAVASGPPAGPPTPGPPAPAAAPSAPPASDASVASGTMGVSSEGQNASDAFSSLSVAPKKEEVSQPEAPPNHPVSKFKAGQTVVYKKSDSSLDIANIVKVHFDDALEPFYTIKLTSGKEKQTDDAHLTVPEPSPLHEEISNMLLLFSSDQLEQVKQFVASMQTASASATPDTLRPPSSQGQPRDSSQPSSQQSSTHGPATNVPSAAPQTPNTSKTADAAGNQWAGIPSPPGKDQESGRGFMGIPSPAALTNPMQQGQQQGGVPPPPVYHHQQSGGAPVPQGMQPHPGQPPMYQNQHHGGQPAPHGSNHAPVPGMYQHPQGGPPAQNIGQQAQSGAQTAQQAYHQQMMNVHQQPQMPHQGQMSGEQQAQMPHQGQMGGHQQPQMSHQQGQMSGHQQPQQQMAAPQIPGQSQMNGQNQQTAAPQMQQTPASPKGNPFDVY